jgi:hypothetical protein
MGARQAEIYLSSVKVLPLSRVYWVSGAGHTPPPSPGIGDIWQEGADFWLWNGFCWTAYEPRDPE